MNDPFPTTLNIDVNDFESRCVQVAKEAFEKKCQTEMLFVKDQLASEQQAKESLENSLSAEIDYLREQLGLMRSVHTQLDEESNRKASLEVALQKAKQQLAEQQQHVSESVSIKVQFDPFCHVTKKIELHLRF